MKNVVLFGGSFDPVHFGHLKMAREALDQTGADELWFIPSHQTPLKGHKLTEDRHRLEMLNLAAKLDPRFKVNDIELKRPGTSYTIDTLRQLKKENPDTHFHFLIGMDQAENFTEWKDWQELLELADFLVMPRGFESVKDSKEDYYHLHSHRQSALRNYGKDNDIVVIAKQQDPYREGTKENRFPEGMKLLEAEPIDVSSSEIRNGYKINYLPAAIRDYIVENELYLINWLKAHMTPHRLAHSLSVARISRDLARAHHLDEHKAYITGLFHDICKDMDLDDLKSWIDVLFAGKHIDHEALWHGYVGAEVVDRFYGLKDPQIKNAIFNHTKGNSYDPYAMILFIADKVDPLRGYDSSAMIDAAMKDLYMGFMMVKRENKEFLKKSLQQETTEEEQV